MKYNNQNITIMKEYLIMSEHNLLRSQQQLEAAAEFALASQIKLFHTPDISRRGNLKRLELDAKLDKSHTWVEVDYHAHGRAESGEVTGVQSTAKISSTAGHYEASIGTNIASGSGFSSASVERPGGYTHQFRGENADRAAVLITSFTARSLGESAAKHADDTIFKLGAAREAFDRSQSL